MKSQMQMSTHLQQKTAGRDGSIKFILYIYFGWQGKVVCNWSFGAIRWIKSLLKPLWTLVCIKQSILPCVLCVLFAMWTGNTGFRCGVTKTFEATVSKIVACVGKVGGFALQECIIILQVLVCT